jgi:hypothetical protein
MPTDRQRFRFMAEHQLSVTWSDDGASIFWRGKPKPGQPAPYHPVARGRNLAEAIDDAIARWERQHGRQIDP